MKKWLWFVGGILLGLVLSYGYRSMRNVIVEKQQAAELAEALEDGWVLSNYMGWPTREDIVVTMEQEVYPVGTPIVYAMVENLSDESIMYGGGDVSVERYLDGQWYRIQTGPVNYVATGIIVQKDSKSFILNALNKKYDYPEGKYRIVFEYFYGKTWGSSKEYRDYISYAEFEIKGKKDPVCYPDIKKQSLKEKKAMEDGCLVIRDGEVQNLEQVLLPVLRMDRELPGELRIVDLDKETVTDVIWERDLDINQKIVRIVQREGKRVTTEEYEELYLWDGYEELMELLFVTEEEE